MGGGDKSHPQQSGHDVNTQNADRQDGGWNGFGASVFVKTKQTHSTVTVSAYSKTKSFWHGLQIFKRTLFKIIRDTKGTFHAKMSLIKDRNGMDLPLDQCNEYRWGYHCITCTRGRRSEQRWQRIPCITSDHLVEDRWNGGLRFCGQLLSSQYSRTFSFPPSVYMVSVGTTSSCNRTCSPFSMVLYIPLLRVTFA